MKRLAITSFVVLSVAHCTITYAQGSLVGHYTGSKGNRRIGVEIKSVEGEVIKGTMSLERKAGKRADNCGGESPAEGTFKNNEVEISAPNELGVAGCDKPRFKGAVDGSSLVGKWDRTDVKLTK